MKIQEAKTIINYLLDNNLELVKNNQNKITIGLEGSHGIGKTAILKEIADERNAKYIRIELGSLEEIGDLVGLPCKEYHMLSPDNEIVWVNEKLLNEYISLGYRVDKNCLPRMNYAIPSWVPNDPEQEVLLVLDDYSRGNSLFMQAIMSLIQFGEYISWKLPNKTHLLLTSNEDNGDYNVTTLDNAQQSRLINFKLEFDHEQYSKWMDKNNLKSEAINFMLLNPEIFTTSNKVNARSYTMFTNAISGIKNFNTVENLSMINTIAKGCFGEDSNIGDLFITFVHNKLDKLISPKEILFDSKDIIFNKLENCLIQDGEYRTDIASVLTIRLINYIENLNKLKSEEVNNILTRIEELITYPKTLLTEDLIFNLIKRMNNMPNFRNKYNKLLINPKIQSKLIF